MSNDTPNTPESGSVQHDKGKRFFLPVDGQEVVLRYQLKGDSQIDMQSTFTPPDLRGRGLARQVVEHALDFAESKGLEVIPTCWYVEKILAERRSADAQ